MLYPLPTVCNILSAGYVGLGEVEGQEHMTDPDGSVEELIDSMSCAFYSLAATGTVRVGRLCKGPQLLACWALELLEEQACHVSPLSPTLRLSLPCPTPAASATGCCCAVHPDPCVTPCCCNIVQHSAVMLLHFGAHFSGTICATGKSRHELSQCC